MLTGLLDAAGASLAANEPASPLLASCVERIAALSGAHADYASLLASQLRHTEPPDPPPLRRRERVAPPERSIVTRILDELAA